MNDFIENVKTPQVGEFYTVKAAVLSVPMFEHSVIPINGPWHEDKDIIKFEYAHFHTDWRFAPHEFYATAMDRHRSPHGVVLIEEVIPSPHYQDKPSKRTIKVEDRIMRMEREWTIFPGPAKSGPATRITTAPWLGKLQDTMKGQTMKCMTCPHRGISLVGAPVVDGIAICSGHGLAWNLTTGKLVPRPLTGEKRESRIL